MPPADRPYVPIVFFAFRIMVGCGLILLAMAITGGILRWRGRLFTTRWFQFAALATTPLGFVAVLAGWTVTETGRQPYVVYGFLRTLDAASPIAAGSVLVSLVLFVVVYNVLLLAFFWYGARIVMRGPEDVGVVQVGHDRDAHAFRLRHAHRGDGQAGGARRPAGARASAQPCRRQPAELRTALDRHQPSLQQQRDDRFAGLRPDGVTGRPGLAGRPVSANPAGRPAVARRHPHHRMRPGSELRLCHEACGANPGRRPNSADHRPADPAARLQPEPRARDRPQ